MVITESAPYRVLVVDDNEDLRTLLRMTLGFHPRFEVTGEASNGLEALHSVEEVLPDLIILDREMPVVGGLEVLPRLRHRCPDALIVMFSAHVDGDLRAAAVLGGADAVRSKTGQSINDLASELEALIVDPPGVAGERVQIRLGPIPSSAARLWVANTLEILRALRRHPREMPSDVEPGLLAVFEGFLEEWATLASNSVDFQWSATAPPDVLGDLVSAWAQLDRLSDDAMERLGCSWSPPEARPFFDALTSAVVAALSTDTGLRKLADDLPSDWSKPES